MAGDIEKVAELEGQVSDMEAQVKELTKALEVAAGGNTDAIEKATLQGQVDTLVGKVEELTDALQKALDDQASAQAAKSEAEEMAKAIAEMDEDERAYLKAFPWQKKGKEEEEEEEEVPEGNGKKKKFPFWKMSREDRQKIIKADKAADETVTLSGRTISKRAVGEDTFEILKSQAAEIAKANASMAKEIEKRETTEFQKRADDEYSHVPGTAEERGNMLRAISKMDEPLRKSFEAALGSAEKLAKAGFDKLGHKGDKPGDESIAKQARDFESRLDKVRSDFPKLSRSEALSKARRENPDLFKAYQEHGEEVARNGGN